MLKYIPKRAISLAKVYPPTLPEYDVIIVGSNMGVILGRHIYSQSKGNTSVFIASSATNRQQHHLTIPYEQGFCKLENYLINNKYVNNPYVPHSDDIKVRLIDPTNNTIQFENNRIIKYKKLVVSTSLQDDLDSINGLQEAIQDAYHPIFSPYILKNNSKQLNTQYWYNFEYGDCFFYIPPFPFTGEVQEYNFLVAYDYWKEKLQRQNKKINLKIINANDNFCQYNKELDQLFKTQILKRNIEVIYNTKLTQINKNSRKLTTINQQGETKEYTYDNMYLLIPQKSHQFLKEAGLTNEQGLLHVNQYTLQHTQNKDIFAFGDITDIPIVKSFFASQQQANIVCHNVMRSLKNLPPLSIYNGYSKTPVYIGKNQITVASQDLVNGKYINNLIDQEGKHISYLRSYYWNYFYQYLNKIYYKYAIWGSPYYIFPPNFNNFKQYAVEELNQEQTQQESLLKQKYFAIPKQNQPNNQQINQDKSEKNKKQKDFSNNQQQEKQYRERLEKENQEKERQEKEKQERKKVEMEKQVEEIQERQEREIQRQQMEKQQIEKEQRERERERQEQEKLEKERKEIERQQKEIDLKIQQQQQEKEKQDKERQEKEMLEKQRQQKENQEKEIQQREKQMREQILLNKQQQQEKQQAQQFQAQQKEREQQNQQIQQQQELNEVPKKKQNELSKSTEQKQQKKKQKKSDSQYVPSEDVQSKKRTPKKPQK